jgi:hypothetical protein
MMDGSIDTVEPEEGDFFEGVTAIVPGYIRPNSIRFQFS